jgi:hypothetical protein
MVERRETAHWIISLLSTNYLPIKNLMKNIIIFLLGISVISVSSCGEDCESCNTTADFTMSEGFLGLGKYNEWQETDTVGVFSDIKFEAICDDMTRYEWKIGDDERSFNEPSFTLYFPTPTTIDIKLIVYKDEDPNCHENTVRVDSLTKKLTIIDSDITYVGGIYRGYNKDNPNNEFDIEIRFDSTEGIFGSYVIHNLPEGCHPKGTLLAPVSLLSFRTRFFMSYSQTRYYCDVPKGWGYLQEDRNTLVIDYYITNPNDNSLIPYQFIGKRI